MKWAVLVLALGAVVWLGLRNSWVRAEEKVAAPTQEEMQKMSGKDLYRVTCKRCHGPNSPAGEYKPLTLIQEQWETFFEKKYTKTHAGLVDSTQARPEWITPEMLGPFRLVTPTMLEKIRKFAVDGAADSEHPMTCG